MVIHFDPSLKLWIDGVDCNRIATNHSNYIWDLSADDYHYHNHKSGRSTNDNLIFIDNWWSIYCMWPLCLVSNINIHHGFLWVHLWCLKRYRHCFSWSLKQPTRNYFGSAPLSWGWISWTIYESHSDLLSIFWRQLLYLQGPRSLWF